MTTTGFLPTHVVPPGGLSAWESPHPDRPTVPLDALLPVQLLERRGDWGHVLCANGWSAWVDGRLLVAVPQDPPAAGAAPARTADPRPLLARAEEALTRYRTEAEALAAGHRDGEAFHERTKGLRVGVVVDGESLWLFDAAHERWVYCDGARLSTFAAVEEPRETPAAARETPAVAIEAQVAPRSAPAAAPASTPREPTRIVGEPARRPEDRRPTDSRPGGTTRPTDRDPADRVAGEGEPTRLVPPVTPDE
ncbi:MULTISPECIES: hypothetical protein [Streptomyces]|uniref:Uncharacterized protein n=1 Tax=Streptomyces caniscabiei TaxID=2746961 RepID=A0ABU4MSU9_9ACTN|nr:MULTISPECIES: hypothetical protein [Streptomyces]MBE4737493.1 hypothetical protein [Streptomyces caniscabiei]MBE4756253.1 hypothetical protein [Streptomyces caniscabiei]MBE4769730.1 hypothetical protein [Streptomyces caniscabiei]MBE4787324.1 hypothetical protein [Streptomyces caniscabiei]MBE4795271.1 hypothetical protein [Streptomyces caniscabiei]